MLSLQVMACSRMGVVRSRTNLLRDEVLTPDCDRLQTLILDLQPLQESPLFPHL
jgi:hypothetical protein